MGQIAKEKLSKCNTFKIGITGSVGKTTTRNMIYEVLNNKSFKNKGNKNNEIGVPLTILDMDYDTDNLVIEMGMDKKGDLSYLADIVRPDIAIITNIGLSHIKNFNSEFDIFMAKFEITKYFKDNNILIINGDDKYLKTLKTKNYKYKIYSVGFLKFNDLYIESYRYNNGIIYFKVNDIDYEFSVNTRSKLLLYNALFAIFVGKYKNISYEDINKGLNNYKNEERRLEVLNGRSWMIINDCYNSSLTSIESATDYLYSYDNRRVCILGDILETGKYNREIHEKIAKYLYNTDIFIAIGDDIKYTYDLVKDKQISYYFKNIDDFFKEYKNILEKDDIILVKASNGCGFKKIVERLVV